MFAERSACPTCHSTESVYPVSRVYVAAITRPENRSAADQKLLRGVLGGLDEAEGEIACLAKRLEPPFGTPPRLGPLHPDLILAAVEVAGVVYIGNAFAARLPGLIPAVCVVVCMAIVYLFFRRWLMARYRRDKAILRVAAREFEKKMKEWQGLYYCTRDRQTFSAGAEQASQSNPPVVALESTREG